ncbi:very short patch repair endonuclease [Streptomyces sioyaensis]|nr:very short patch repair endonuclease [Streptomyces sioyaensis]
MAPERRSWASSDRVRASMRSNRSRDTAPELALRRAVHSRGMRYFVCRRPLPSLRRTADLVFSRAKVAVFLDGCYWHGCPEHCVLAGRNTYYWVSKIQRNKERDRETDSLLRDAGWVSIRIWEHEDPNHAAEKVLDVVTLRRAALGMKVR